MKEAAGGTIPAGHNSKQHAGHLNFQNWCWVLTVDGTAILNRPFSQFAVNKAFQII
jgi:hypothetical protein